MKPLQGVLFVAAAAVAVSLLWSRVLPLFFNTAQNQELLSKARRAMNDVAPLHVDDKPISEATYNHGGQIGLGRTYSSAVAIHESEARFLALAVDEKAASREEKAFCHGDVQVGFDSNNNGNTYYIYAVIDRTATRPLGCH